MSSATITLILAEDSRSLNAPTFCETLLSLRYSASKKEREREREREKERQRETKRNKGTKTQESN